jgi:hypothetical protein
MKKLILIALLFIGFNSYAQFDKGGVMALSNKAVFALDTSARNIIHIIEDERVAAGGAVFNSYERFYVNYIVTNLKNYGIWYKCKAIYGFVGGTAASDKWNWKDMRDLDAAFRLTYSGTITHSNNGIQGDGSTGYVNTHLIPSSILTSINNLSIGCYIDNYFPIGAFVDMGCISGDGSVNRLALRGPYTSSYISASASIGSTGVENNTNFYPSSLSNFIIGQRSSSTLATIYVNGLPSAINNNTNTGFFPTNIFYLLAFNSNSSPTGFTQRLMKFAFIRDASFTDLQASQMSRIITYAQSMRANF